MHITHNKQHKNTTSSTACTYSDNTHLENTHTAAHYLGTFDVFTFAFYLCSTFYYLSLLPTKHCFGHFRFLALLFL
jgi:hypothetical protein